MSQLEASSGNTDPGVAMFGRQRPALDLEIAAAGGGKAYAKAILIALDGYLQICENSPRGPDQRYVGLALNGVKYAISEYLVAAPPSLVHPEGPVATFAAPAEHLYHPDEGDGLRLPIRGCLGRNGVDAAFAAISLLSDAQERVNPVGANGYVRKALEVARELLDATLELNGQPAPKSIVEDGEVCLVLAAHAMRQAKAQAAVGHHETAHQMCILGGHLIKHARLLLGCGMSDEPRALQVLAEIEDVCRAAFTGLPAPDLQAMAAMAREYARAGRGESPWLEPQVADGSGKKFLPVVFVGDRCWQLTGVADERGRVSTIDAQDYESTWRRVAYLRSLMDAEAVPERLRWHQISGGRGPVVAVGAQTWAQILDIAKESTQPVGDRRLAMG